jgi:hypothetical protein
LPTLAPGTPVGDYRVGDLLRGGPDGAVYRATQPALGRGVALHVAAGPPGSPEAERFLAEARRLAGLEHPNLLPVYEAGTASGVAFAAAAPGGRPLAELLDEGPLPVEQAVGIGGQVAAALEALDGATDAAADPATVLVADEAGSARAYLSPLEAPRGEGGESSVASFARLLGAMVGGPDSVEGELAAVLRRAGSGGDATPTAVAAAAAAALAPRPRERTRLRPITPLVAAAAAAAVVAVVLLSEGGSEEAPPASTPAARIVAIISVGGQPASVSYGEGSLWAATGDRRLVRTDPRNNRVQGAPITFLPARGQSNISVRAGSGAVFAIDGHAGTIVRIDPASGRIIERARQPYVIQGAAVDGDTLWITRTTPRPCSPDATISWPSMPARCCHGAGRCRWAPSRSTSSSTSARCS